MVESACLHLGNVCHWSAQPGACNRCTTSVDCINLMQLQEEEEAFDMLLPANKSDRMCHSVAFTMCAYSCGNL